MSLTKTSGFWFTVGTSVPLSEQEKLNNENKMRNILELITYPLVY